MVIGVTGGIASGKSEVCRVLEEKGFVIIDADEISHHVLENPDVIGKVTEVFGNEVLTTSDEKRGPLMIDRKKLGKIVFADKNKMEMLENITHPAIIDQIRVIIYNNPKKDYVIEAYKIVSSELMDLCDELWVVHAEPEQQLKRLIENRHMSYEDAMARLKLQEEHDWDEAKADQIIYSTEPIETMKDQVCKALRSRIEENREEKIGNNYQ